MVCIFLEIDRAFEFAFRKLLGEIEAEFVRNLKGLVDFEVHESQKKASSMPRPRPQSIEASPSIHRGLALDPSRPRPQSIDPSPSIHRSIDPLFLQLICQYIAVRLCMAWSNLIDKITSDRGLATYSKGNSALYRNLLQQTPTGGGHKLIMLLVLIYLTQNCIIFCSVFLNAQIVLTCK
jgi:hypothetical protein